MKVISHRLNGYSVHPRDLQRSVLEATGKFDSVEIDVRITRDSVAIIHHDRWATDHKGQWRAIDEMDFADYAIAHRSVVTLEVFLKLWREIDRPEVDLILDLKTPRQVEQQVELVDKMGLIDRTRFISWHPGALHVLANSGTVSKLGFSWFAAANPVVLKALQSILFTQPARIALGAIAQPFSPVFSRDMATVQFRETFDLETLDTSSMADVAVIARNPLFSGSMAVQFGTGALACIPLAWASKELVSGLKQMGLKVAAFSAATDNQLEKARRMGCDAAFVDEPAIVH